MNRPGRFGIGSLLGTVLGFINPALGLAYRGITSIPGVVDKFKSSNTLADFFGSLRGPKNITDDDDTTLLDQVSPDLPFAQSYLNQIKSQLPSTVNQPTGIINTMALDRFQPSYNFGMPDPTGAINKDQFTSSDGLGIYDG